MMVLSNVRRSCRLRAVIAALVLPDWELDTLGVRLVCSESRDLRGPVKTEGKIKGPARIRPQSQSARRLGTARRLAACVPLQNANPYGIKIGRVSFSMPYASLRWSVCHGLA